MAPFIPSGTLFDDKVATRTMGTKDPRHFVRGDDANALKGAAFELRQAVVNVSSSLAASIATLSSSFSSSLTSQFGVFASAYLSSPLALPAGSITIMNYDTKDYDPLNVITTGATWKFTVPAGKGGLYHVSAGADVTTLPPGVILHFHLFRNNVMYRRFGYVVNNDATLGNFYGVWGSMDVVLGESDFVDVRVSHGYASALSINADAGDKENFMTIHRVFGS
jgi:hypothetical protein